MDPLIFKPDRSRNTARRVFGTTLALGGGGLGCAFLLIGLLLIPVALEGAKTNKGALWLFMVPAAGLLFILVFGGFGVVLWRTGASESVVLSAEAIVLDTGKAATTLYLHEIASLDATWVWDSPRAGHWALVISAQSGGRIELGIAQGAYLAIFDVRPILRALLPLLSPTVQIDPRIQAYATTGSMQAETRSNPR